jgi:hypothetical protein
VSDYEKFIIYKAIILVIIAGLGSFFYGLFTGKSLWEERRDKEAAKPDDQNSIEP